MSAPTSLQKDLKTFEDMMPYCNCGIKVEDVKAKINYICVETNCDSYKKLKDKLDFSRYYCDYCAENHPHGIVKIFYKTRQLNEQWQKIKYNLYAIEKDFNEITHPMNPLIDYF